MALRMITEKTMNIVAKQFQSIMGSNLSRYGLRAEDLLIEQSPDVKEAMQLADSDIIIARTRRLKRAIDLDYKRKNLQDYAPNMLLEPFKEELWDDVLKLRARDAELAMLRSGKTN
mmetsp:Transcript_12822/g.19494  ORF Transcript_12822/g.19494 Transcript_12822/m.19494 type:complete len:116 (-) Transcript_12822:78-425(-)